MSNLKYACFMPHPPIILPEVGGRETDKCRDTIDAMGQVAGRLVDADPDTVVIITPHGNVFQDAVALTAVDRLQGDMGQFRAPMVKFDYPNETRLASELRDKCSEKGIAVAFIDEELAGDYGLNLSLDHGVMVPLYYLKKAGFNGSLVVVAMGFLPPLELYTFGMALQQAGESADSNVAVVASGDLSHRLTPGAPAGFSPRGEKFDRELREALEQGAVEKIVHLPRAFVEEAGECGLRPLIMLLGCLDGYKIQPQVISYQGPFGVGYLVAELFRGGNKGESLISKLKSYQEETMTKVRKNEHAIVRLARETLEGFIRHGKVIEPDFKLPEGFPQRAGVFVSLKKHGQLRGCIGTVEPTRDSLTEEVMHNALGAGLRDPRFHPVEEHELPEITYSVDILHPPEEIESIDELDPKEYGVIVTSGSRSGLLLPNLEGIDTPKEQVRIAMHKGGIRPGEKYQLKRFKVDRYQ